MWDFPSTRMGRAENNFFEDIYSVIQPPLPPSMTWAFGLDVFASYLANIFYYCFILFFFPHSCDAILHAAAIAAVLHQQQLTRWFSHGTSPWGMRFLQFSVRGG